MLTLYFPLSHFWFKKKQRALLISVLLNKPENTLSRPLLHRASAAQLTSGGAPVRPPRNSATVDEASPARLKGQRALRPVFLHVLGRIRGLRRTPCGSLGFGSHFTEMPDVWQRCCYGKLPPKDQAKSRSQKGGVTRYTSVHRDAKSTTLGVRIKIPAPPPDSHPCPSSWACLRSSSSNGGTGVCPGPQEWIF